MEAKDDPWVRCKYCGRKIHHKKVWNSTKGGFDDAHDKDEEHICNVCEKLEIEKNYWRS